MGAICSGYDGVAQANVIEPMSQPHEPPFAVEQFVAEELGNSSYVVADLASRHAAVIDPLRDVQQYIDLARARGWTLAYALDTHLHNDFLSGGAELAAAGHGTYMSPVEDGRGPARRIQDGEALSLGALRLEVLHTPGHTPEHLSYRLLDAGGVPRVLFSGGALMVGTMARPDLLGPDHTFSLALMAHATLRDVLAPMPDDLDVLPTHGGGSFCSASRSGDRTTTLGRERRDNPLFGKPDFLDFLAILANQGEYPAYYDQMAPRNRAGVPVLGVPLAALEQLEPEALDREAGAGSTVVDVRPHARHDLGAVPGSINVGVNGPMSAWLGWVLPLDRPLVLVADSEAEATDARRKLVRIGFDRVRGWLLFADWESQDRPCRRTRRGEMADLAEWIAKGEVFAVVDSRQEREWVTGHIPGAMHAMPAQVVDATRSLRAGTLVAIHCSTGYRSSLAASLLASDGRLVPWHIVDGIDRWKELGHPVTVPG